MKKQTNKRMKKTNHMSQLKWQSTYGNQHIEMEDKEEASHQLIHNQITKVNQKNKQNKQKK